MNSQGAQKIRTGLILGVIAGLLSLVIVLPLVLVSGVDIRGTSAQAETANEFIMHLADERYSEAYDLTSRQFQDDTSLEELQVFVNSFPVIANTKVISFTFRGVENGMRVVSGTMYSDIDSSPVTVIFVKEDGEWKILSISLDPDDAPGS